MTERESFVASMRDRPAEDTPRLAFADWLDDRGEHDRAELIRVQVEFERLRDVIRPGIEGPVFAEDFELVSEMARNWSRKMKLARRERELLTDERRREWSGIKCPVCKRGCETDSLGEVIEQWCRMCDRTCFAPVEFRRGFVYRVTARMGDVLREVPTDPKRGVGIAPDGGLMYRTPAPTWQPTAWAHAVALAHPVVEWHIVDREPSYDMGEWGWHDEQLPALVRAEMPTDWLNTPEAARLSLAQAMGRVVRRLCGLSTKELR